MNTRTLKTGILAIILSTAPHGIAGLPGNWEIRDSGFAGTLNGVAAAPGQVVAVGDNGAILVSDNGYGWTHLPFNAGGGDFHCVAFGNGIYVAGGTLACLMAISSDGVHWTPIQGTGSIHANFGVTFARGRFVAVGRGTSPVPNSRLITSTNGIDWETVVRPTTNTLRAITFGNGKYVAVGDHGTIITSPDGIEWAVQNSGTEHLLRSVIFTGREFLAGGDSSSLLTSGDGISWVSVPFNSFDVRGLAACGTAVVAVGALDSGGRAQSSLDGLSWTESVAAVPASLNAIVQYDLGRFIAVGVNGLIVDSAAWADNPVNTWTKNTDGYWQETFWSLGHVPSWKDHSIVFTNAGYKTLEIDASTTRDYPDSLKISALILDAPQDSHNSLRLNNAGFDVPLRINSTLRVPENTSLVCEKSALEASRLEVSGLATFTNNALATFEDGIVIGVTRTGSVNHISGSVFANAVRVGGDVPGIWNQSGGTLETGEGALIVAPGSIYNLRGGRLLAAGDLVVGDTVSPNPGELNFATGSAEVNGTLTLPNGAITLSNATVTVSNAIIGAAISDSPARFVQVAGQLRVRGRLTIQGVYELHGGSLEPASIALEGLLDADPYTAIGSAGELEFAGGTLRANRYAYLGRISVLSNSTLDFRGTVSNLYFEKGGPFAGILLITNWIQGTNRLFVSLSADQLGRIRFVNPGGFSPGIYSARIIPSGEVVPAPRLISYQRGRDSLVLAWPEGYRLFSATNVAGPYSLLTNVTSPYAASYTDPQRFFITANEN